MGLPLMILRFVATPILGIAIFAGLLLTLVVNNIVDKLLNAEFYTDTIAEQNTYNRIYDDVLLDQKSNAVCFIFVKKQQFMTISGGRLHIPTTSLFEKF